MVLACHGASLWPVRLVARNFENVNDMFIPRRFNNYSQLLINCVIPDSHLQAYRLIIIITIIVRSIIIYVIHVFLFSHVTLRHNISCFLALRSFPITGFFLKAQSTTQKRKKREPTRAKNIYPVISRDEGFPRSF